MIFEEIKANKERPTRVIFGTDWWSDCDDVAALAILLKAHKHGLIDLKAIGVNSVMKYSAPSLKAVCEQYDLGSIPIGLDSRAKRKGTLCLYQKALAAHCKSGFSNADCPEAFKLYRRALASLKEKAVVVDVGFPQIIMEVLRSQPDEISDLSGMQLVKNKVSEIILMGGRWDKPTGMEYNFCAYRLNRKAAAYLCEHCPVPLTFLGYEVGKDVITGGKTAPGLVGTAYAAHFSANGRPSWDPMTALFAIVGNAEQAGYRKVQGKAAVDPKTGRNRFEAFDGGPHAYLVKTKEDSFYKKQIDDILGMGKSRPEGSFEIRQIGLDEYSNCSAIWNMETCPHTQTFIAQIKAGVREVYILTVDGAYIAECDLVYENPEYGTIPGQRAYLSRLIVKKAQREKGYGKAISEYVLALAKEKGYREIALGVNCNNTAAVRLYQSLGFTIYEEAEDVDGKFYRMEKNL